MDIELQSDAPGRQRRDGPRCHFTRRPLLLLNRLLKMEVGSG